MQESLAVLPAASSLEEVARQLAEELRLPVLSSKYKLSPLPDEFAYLLVLEDSGLSLQQTGKKAAGPLRVNFESNRLYYRSQVESLNKQMIARAVGVKGERLPSIVDATAGLGVDSFLLASMGCQVLMLERVPVVYALLNDGLQRACVSLEADVNDAAHRLQLSCMDALQYLEPLSAKNYPDVLYLDPMFPEKRHKALPKKEMQYFQVLVGADPDSSELLRIGLERVRNRVVVKRPRRGPPLDGRKPSHSLMGKSTRYDVYIVD